MRIRKAIAVFQARNITCVGLCPMPCFIEKPTETLKGWSNSSKNRLIELCVQHKSTLETHWYGWLNIRHVTRVYSEAAQEILATCTLVACVSWMFSCYVSYYLHFPSRTYVHAIFPKGNPRFVRSFIQKCDVHFPSIFHIFVRFAGILDSAAATLPHLSVLRLEWRICDQEPINSGAELPYANCHSEAFLFMSCNLFHPLQVRGTLDQAYSFSLDATRAASTRAITTGYTSHYATIEASEEYCIIYLSRPFKPPYGTNTQR